MLREIASAPAVTTEAGSTPAVGRSEDVSREFASSFALTRPEFALLGFTWILTGIPRGVGLSPGEVTRFHTFTRVTARRDLRALLGILIFFNLFFWGTDAWIFRAIPQVLPVMDTGRLQLLGVTVGGLLASWLWPMSALPIGMVCGGCACWILAWGLGRMDLASEGLFSYVLALVFTPLLTWLAPLRRVGLTATYTAIVLWGFYGCAPWRLEGVLTSSMIAHLLFLACMSVLIGFSLDKQRLELFVVQSTLARERDKLEERVAEKSLSLRQLISHLDVVEDNLRTHLAQELHDEMGQLLAAQRLVLKTAIRRYGASPEVIGPNLTQLAELIDQVTTSVRGILTDLRPLPLGELGLGGGLQWLVQHTQERSQLVARVNLPPQLPTFSQEVEVAVYRCVQEALTNVVKHAEAKSFGLDAEVHPDQLVLTVWDDGRGMAGGSQGEAAPQKMGLRGIRERLANLRGTLTLQSAPGGGTQLQLSIPLVVATPRTSGA